MCGVVLGAVTPAAATGPSVSLSMSADATVLPASTERTYVTATASEEVGSGYSIVILDGSGAIQRTCFSVAVCTTSVSLEPGGARSFRSQIVSSDSPDVALRVSDPLSVRRGMWSLELSSDRVTVPASSDRAYVTATASEEVRGDYSIWIRDHTGSVRRSCSNTDVCTSTALLAPGQSESFTAEVVNNAIPDSSWAKTGAFAIARKAWALTLTAPTPVMPAGATSAPVVATASEPVPPSLYSIQFINSGGQVVQTCTSVLSDSCGGNIDLTNGGMGSIWARIVSFEGDVVASAGPVSATNLGDQALLGSTSVASLALQLEQRLGAESACLALGEQVRTHATGSSVPDVTLVCMNGGVRSALEMIARLGGLGKAISAVESLTAADSEPAPSSPHPDCDSVAFDGSCLDAGSPDANAPAPQPDPAGGGIQPPPNCMDPSTAQMLIDAMPVQLHHVATQYGDWAEDFNEILGKYGLSVTDTTLNVIAVPHRGPHPKEYHQWVMDNVEIADQVANGDVATFRSLFKQWISDRIEADPTITRLAYWKCRR